MARKCVALTTVTQIASGYLINMTVVESSSHQTVR